MLCVPRDYFGNKTFILSFITLARCTKRLAGDAKGTWGASVKTLPFQVKKEKEVTCPGLIYCNLQYLHLHSWIWIN